MQDQAYKHCSESRVSISQLMLPSHSNFGGKIHGGYILSMMDEVAFACGSKHSGHYCVTASVNTVDFLAPIEIGELVTMKASVNYVGNSSMVIGIKVEAENIQSGISKHCNSSYFTMVAKDENSKSVKVPGLILRSLDDVRRFVRSIQRQAHNASRRKEFKEDVFLYEKYLNQLDGYNVKIDVKK